MDKIEAKELQRGFNRIITQLQRAKVLECYRYLEEYRLIAIDGTGYFSSHDIFCENCCVKEHRDGSKTYYHQMLSAVIVHPDYWQVFPVMLEPILKQDGATKNDCEHNGLKRLIVNLRKAHPQVKIIVTLDGLYADGVIIKLLKSLDIRFIITAKESDLSYCYEFFHVTKKEHYGIEKEGYSQQFYWKNRLPLNGTHHECEVNLLCYEEKIQKRKKEAFQKFAWITDIDIQPDTIEEIMKGGRARWHIENNTFNTLKNQGYHFDHNFGHGYQNLSVVMAYLMFTAFLIEQVQAFCCKQFKAALKKQKRLSYLWEKMRGYFFSFLIDRWEDLYGILIEGRQIPLTPLLRADTS